MATNALAKAAREMERAQARAAKEEARQLREREKELARQAAEAEKAAAKAEVEAFERELAALTSAHKVPPKFYNWHAQRFSLPPHPPAFHTKQHLREAAETILLTRQYDGLEERLVVAWTKDEQAYYASHSAYEERYARWARLKTVAQQLHAGEASALLEAHAELEAQGFGGAEGSGIVLQPCDAKRLYVAIRVSARDIVPDEVKTLTQAGKVSVKAMPKNRAREIYEDHVCSRCLAIARRLFGILPVTEVIVTAYAPSVSSVSGNETDVPVVSAHFTKEAFAALNFDELDPSDALQSFRHAGDVRASRRGEDFKPIRPLAFETPSQSESPADDVPTLAANIDALRTAFRKFQIRNTRSTPAAALIEQA
jgi:hypothetical protein